MRITLLFLLIQFIVNGQTVSPIPLCTLPPSIFESSGLERTSTGTFFTHNDSGNEAVIYEINDQCEIVRLIYLNGVQNNDWEDLALTPTGILYVGDFGNNQNDRQDLAIYYFDTNTLPLGESTLIPSIIQFHFSEQSLFPPQDNQMNFDTEAMIYKNDSLFLFTKNRTTPYSGFTYEYALPAAEGNYVLSRLDSFWVGNQSYACSVTSADFLPEFNRLYLLTSLEILSFNTSTNNKLLSNINQRLHFLDITQKEGLSILDTCNFYLSDEKNDQLNNGGNIYSIQICNVTSIKLNEKKEFRFFPQPIDSKILFELENGLTQNEQIDIHIFDTKGVSILHEKIAYPFHLNLMNIQNGCYILCIEYQNHTQRELIEIKHMN